MVIACDVPARGRDKQCRKCCQNENFTDHVCMILAREKGNGRLFGGGRLRSVQRSSRDAITHRGCDRTERRVQVRTDELHSRDDHDGNARGDQAVFDGRRAGFVRQETSETRFFMVSLRLIDTLGCPARADLYKTAHCLDTM